MNDHFVSQNLFGAHVPMWPMLLLVAVITLAIALGFFIAVGLLLLYGKFFFHYDGSASLPDLNVLLIFFSAFLGWIPVGTLLANRLLFLIPASRRIGEAFFIERSLPGFSDSHEKLKKQVVWFSLICIPCLFLGFVL